jgi:hypothetical protein
MTDLISQQAAQTRVRDAEACARQGDYIEALALLSEALGDLLDDYANRKRTRYNKSAFDFALTPPSATSTSARSRRSTTSSASRSRPSPTRHMR